MTEQDIDGATLGACFREMADFLEETVASHCGGSIPNGERVVIKARFVELWQRCNAAAAEYEIAMNNVGLA